MKKFLSDLIKEAVAQIISDLKIEYAEEIVYDHYFIRYSIKNIKYSLVLKLETKSHFTYKFEEKIIPLHSLDQTAVNYKIESVVKL